MSRSLNKGGLTTIWKDRGIKHATNQKLAKAFVFLIVQHGAETWTMRKAERKKVDEFEMWCLRRVTRVSKTSSRSGHWNRGWHKEVLRRFTPGVGHDSTAQGDTVTESGIPTGFEVTTMATHSVSFFQERLCCIIIK